MYINYFHYFCIVISNQRLMERFFRRKLYDKLLTWKQEKKGKTALLIEGARRVGKSTIVEEFAKHEYKSYILIDFNKVGKRIKELFDDLNNLDYIFLTLQANYGVNLEPRKSVIIFDEVQKCPLARQAIKYLVADGRYDYIETGSLISIKKNTQNITIPSEAIRQPCRCCVRSTRSDCHWAQHSERKCVSFVFICWWEVCRRL